MPTSAPKPCSQCGTLVHDGTSRCTAHKVVAGKFADARRGSRQSRGYGAEWDRLRLTILKRDAELCQVCLAAGRYVEGKIVDHRMPKAAGGTDDPSNLRTICADCHAPKTGAEGGRGRGGRVPSESAEASGTGLEVKFLRAGVLGEGVPPAQAKWGMA